MNVNLLSTKTSGIMAIELDFFLLERQFNDVKSNDKSESLISSFVVLPFLSRSCSSFYTGIC